MSLPFANTAIDYLIRLNIDKSEQRESLGDNRNHLHVRLRHRLCQHGLGGR